jgi:hypothetical protein
MTDDKHPMVAVEWHDSGLSFALAWDDEDSLIERAKKWNGSCTTVGFLLYEDERCLAIVLTRDNNQEMDNEQKWSQVMLVSRDNLTSIHTLDLGSPRPLAFVPATTSEEPPATPEAPTPPDAPLSVPSRYGPGLFSWCPAHRRPEKRGTHIPMDGLADRPLDYAGIGWP